VTFLFRDLMDVKSVGFIFALQILPTIIFFSALTSVLFYLGVIQKVVYALAWALEQDHEVERRREPEHGGQHLPGPDRIH
jgi:nucleoside permease NupC